MQQCCGKSIEMATLEELQAKVTELTDALSAQAETNNGLKADLTKAKAELRKGQTIDPNEYNALQTENEALKTKLNEADKAVKSVIGERDKLAKTLETESAVTINMQRERDLTEGLAGINVTNPINLKAAKAMLAASVQVVTDGDKRITKVGDKTLAEHLKEWAASDEGKHFVAAPNNNGGGGQGGGNQSATLKTMKRTEFVGLPQADKVKFSNTGGTLID